MDFLVETSARHIHLTDAAIETLYGPGAKLEVKKMLSQPGQFACTNEKIKLCGPKGELMVSVLGPARKACQVEGTPGIRLVGPAGELEIAEGCIIAKRHVHMTPADAAAFGVSNGQIVSVKVDTGKGRAVVFGDTVIRVSDKFALAMHIDTDECNAAAAFGEVRGEIVA